MLSSSIGMLGADGIVNRHPIRPDPKLFARVLLTATIIAVLAAIVVIRFYQIRATLAAVIVPTIVAVAMTRFCGAFLQSRMRSAASLMLLHSLNYILLTTALVSTVYHFDDVETFFSLLR